MLILSLTRVPWSQMAWDELKLASLRCNLVFSCEITVRSWVSCFLLQVEGSLRFIAQSSSSGNSFQCEPQRTRTNLTQSHIVHIVLWSLHIDFHGWTTNRKTLINHNLSKLQYVPHIILHAQIINASQPTLSNTCKGSFRIRNQAYAAIHLFSWSTPSNFHWDTWFSAPRNLQFHAFLFSFLRTSRCRISIPQVHIHSFRSDLAYLVEAVFFHSLQMGTTN